jgi:hypothetical protein
MDCIRCDEPIPAKRLEAMPETRVCVDCSAAIGGEFHCGVELERTSKPGSMKLNYGSAKLVRVRKSLHEIRGGGKRR